MAITVAAATAIYDGPTATKEAHVLLGWREKEKVWCLIGGRQEGDESTEQTAVREVLEEAGITIKAPLEPISFHTGEHDPKTNVHGVHHYVVLNYAAEVKNLYPKLPTPIDPAITDFMWADLSDISQWKFPIWPTCRNALHRLIELKEW